jgi:NADPH2:quinone reductase
LNSLAPRGFFGSFGTTTGAPQPVAVSKLQKNGSLYFTRPTLITYTDFTKDLRHSAGEVFKMFGQGVLKININQLYALNDIVK